MPIKLDGKTVTVHIGGLPRVGQEIKNFRKNNKNTLVVHAGDAVTGTLFIIRYLREKRMLNL